jgi:hypothetical protein
MRKKKKKKSQIQQIRGAKRKPIHKMTTKSITLKQTHTQTPYKKTKIEVPTCANLEKSTKKALRRKQEEEEKKKKSLPFWVTPKASKP